MWPYPWCDGQRLRGCDEFAPEIGCKDATHLKRYVQNPFPYGGYPLDSFI